MNTREYLKSENGVWKKCKCYLNKAETMSGKLGWLL